MASERTDAYMHARTQRARACRRTWERRSKMATRPPLVPTATCMPAGSKRSAVRPCAKKVAAVAARSAAASASASSRAH